MGRRFVWQWLEAKKTFGGDQKCSDLKTFQRPIGAEKRAVDSLTLQVEPGDIYGFIGHNGAGKTTAIRSAVGVLDFTEGDIFINGVSVKARSHALQAGSCIYTGQSRHI